MRTPASMPWLSGLAVGTLAAGLALRLLVVGGAGPPAESLAVGLLLFGSGLILADRATKWKLPARALAFVVPVAFAVHLLAGTPAQFLRSSTWMAVAMAALACRDVVVNLGGLPLLRHGLLAGGWMLSVYGIVQTLWLRRAIAEEVLGSGHPLDTTDMGRAFLESQRASTVFTSPNVFASFLLLAGLPALIMAWPRRQERAASVFFGLVAVCGFAASGSAGACAAAALAIPLGLAVTEPPRSELRRRYLLVALAVLIGLAVFTSLALSSPDLSGKLLTLRVRLDYWMTGLRALAPHQASDWISLLVGSGAETVGTRMVAATLPSASFSRDPHQCLLAMALEWGVPLTLLIAWFAAVRLRAARAACATASALEGALLVNTSKAPPVLHQVPFAIGLALGVLLSVVLYPMVSFFPPSHPAPTLVDAAVLTVLGVLAWRLARRIPVTDALANRAWFVGCLAFALHTFMDVQAAIAPITIAAVASFAALPGHGHCPTASGRHLARGAAAIFGFLAVLTALACVLRADALPVR